VVNWPEQFDNMKFPVSFNQYWMYTNSQRDR
jgi:hypothetical protein